MCVLLHVHTSVLAVGSCVPTGTVTERNVKTTACPSIQTSEMTTCNNKHMHAHAAYASANNGLYVRIISIIIHVLSCVYIHLCSGSGVLWRL